MRCFMNTFRTNVEKRIERMKYITLHHKGLHLMSAAAQHTATWFQVPFSTGLRENTKLNIHLVGLLRIYKVFDWSLQSPELYGPVH